MIETDTCLKILNDSYSKAISQITKPFINDAVILQRVEIVAFCLKNRAGVRALLAGALAKVYQPKFDIRKPYTDIGGRAQKGCFSGRAFDERYIQTLTSRPYLADAQILHPFAPQVHRWTADVEIGRHHLVLLAGSGGQDNPATQRHLLGSAVG